MGDSKLDSKLDDTKGCLGVEIRTMVTSIPIQPKDLTSSVFYNAKITLEKHMNRKVDRKGIYVIEVMGIQAILSCEIPNECLSGNCIMTIQYVAKVIIPRDDALVPAQVIKIVPGKLAQAVAGPLSGRANSPPIVIISKLDDTDNESIAVNQWILVKIIKSTSITNAHQIHAYASVEKIGDEYKNLHDRLFYPGKKDPYTAPP